MFPPRKHESRLAEQNASQSKFSSVVQLRSEFDMIEHRTREFDFINCFLPINVVLRQFVEETSQSLFLRQHEFQVLYKVQKIGDRLNTLLKLISHARSVSEISRPSLGVAIEGPRFDTKQRN